MYICICIYICVHIYIYINPGPAVQEMELLKEFETLALSVSRPQAGVAS